MLDQEENNELLARWIVDELSPEELAEFKTHPEYKTYAKIKAGADALDLREYDIESALSSIKSIDKSTAKNTNPVRELWPYIAVAATIVLLFGVFLFSSGTSYTTGFGEQMAVTLPDGSEVILNAKSTLRFNEREWDKNRNVALTGEAYFKVSKKGTTFTVNTGNGEVVVLGTAFTINTYDTFFETVCYEGKVQVTSGSYKEILTAGNAFRSISKKAESWTLQEKTPSWINQISSFRSVPVKIVLDALEKQFDLTIERNNIDTNVIYTGTFPNNDKNVALSTVFSTLGFSYQLTEDEKTVVVEP